MGYNRWDMLPIFTKKKLWDEEGRLMGEYEMTGVPRMTRMPKPPRHLSMAMRVTLEEYNKYEQERVTGKRAMKAVGMSRNSAIAKRLRDRGYQGADAETVRDCLRYLADSRHLNVALDSIG